jgi:hypothetical protein
MELRLNVIVSWVFHVSALFKARNQPNFRKILIRRGLQGDVERENWSENLPRNHGGHAIGGVVRRGQNVRRGTSAPVSR